MGSGKAGSVSFSAGEVIVYPSHGVGKVAGIEEQEVAGMKLELLVLTFERERMTIRLPKGKVPGSGLRHVMDAATAGKVLDLLGGKAKKSRDLWARRSQVYDAKLVSGDPMVLAEVVRDLWRPADAEPASHSERTIYDNAIARLASELALSLDKSETEAVALAEGRMAARKGGAKDDEAERAAA